MDGEQRQLSPQRLREPLSSLQINGLQRSAPNIPPNSYPIRNPSHHMPINGPVSRPPNMTVGGPQPAVNLPNPNTLQPGTVYLIRSPSGELQLVRLAPNVQPGVGGNIPRPLLNQPANVRFPAPGQVAGQQQQSQGPQIPSTSQNQLATQMQTSVPVPHGMQNTQPSGSHLPNHVGMPSNIPSMGPGNMPAMRPGLSAMPASLPHQNMPPGPGGMLHQMAQKIENPLGKAIQFFKALLDMSRGQTPSMFETARDLLQQLVNARINPDIFAQRLQEELKSTPQPILAPLLKTCLQQLRQSLWDGAENPDRGIRIDGIEKPPLAALALTDPNAILNSINPSSMSAGASSVRKKAFCKSAVKIADEKVILSDSRSPSATTKSSKNKGSKASATTGGSEMQHPAFSQIPPVTPSSKSDKVKAPKSITSEKKPSKPKKESKKKDFESSSQPGSVGGGKEQKEPKLDEDELNDVAAMGGVNLSEESARLASAEFLDTQTRSIDDQSLIPVEILRRRVLSSVKGLVQEEIPNDVLRIMSHAVEARIRNCCERLDVIAEHRSESVRGHAQYKVTQDCRAQMKFLEELDRVEKRKREEEEKETLLRAAKSRNRPEDPEHMKLKMKAKELQRVEQEELRTREANQAALAELVGGRKKPRLDTPGAPSAGLASGGVGGLGGLSGKNEVKSQPYRPRIKRASLRDVVFMMETNPKQSKSPLLYQILHQIK